MTTPAEVAADFHARARAHAAKIVARNGATGAQAGADGTGEGRTRPIPRDMPPPANEIWTEIVR